MAVWSEVRLSNLGPADRLDAEYYKPAYLKLTRRLAKVNCMSIEQLGFVTDGIHASPEVVEDDGVRYLSAKCVKDDDFSLGDTLQISKAQDSANKRTRLQVGDVLLTTVGTIGNTAVVTPDILPANIDRHLGLIRLSEGAPIDPYYLAVFLNSSFGRFQTLRDATGNVQLNLFIEKIKKINVPVFLSARAVSELAQSAYGERIKADNYYVEAEALLLSSLGLDKLDLSPSLFYIRNCSNTTSAGRFDAEYFSPRYQRVLNHLRKGRQTIGDVAPLAERKFQAEAGATFSYIEIGNLTGNGEAQAEVMDGGDAPSRAQWIVQPGDVISSTVRPIRRLSAVISKEQAGHVCSSGFAVLHPTGIEPEILLVYLRLPIVCEILDLHTTASMYPAIPVEQLLRIPIALPATSVRDRIVDKVRVAFAARREAARLLDEAKSTVERLILEN